MAQGSDIVLNGDGYMLVPGPGRAGYVRAQDGESEGRTGRQVQTDFYGGTRRAVQLESDRGWASHQVGPALSGQGVGPWPYSQARAMPGGAPAFATSQRLPWALVREYVYFAVGQYLYRSGAISSGVWAAPVQVYDAGAGNDITGICYYGGNLLLAFGAAKDITHGVYPAFTVPSVLFAGERGYDIVSYQGFAVWSEARAAWLPNTLRLVNGSNIEQRFTDAPIQRVASAGSSVMVATSQATYRFDASVTKVTAANPAPPPDYTEFDRWVGELDPYFQHGVSASGDDYRFIVGFGGRTYAWVAGGVMEHDPQGDRAGWKPAGLEGAACYGACVAAGYLVVSILSDAGHYELWAYDGAGWWLVQDNGTSVPLLQPIPAAGHGHYDVMVPVSGSTNLLCLRLEPRSAIVGTLPASGDVSYRSSLLDAGERDKDKAWRKVGAVFATPEVTGNPASADLVQLQLHYSIDAGSSWNVGQFQSWSANTLATNNFELGADIASDAAVSRFLQLRVTWASVADWAPVLVGLWAEFETLDSPARRRRWSFAVVAQDQTIDRDGVPLARTGREMIAELWDHWQAGSTLPFRDLDYDTDAVERRVRIVGIREDVAMPHQAGKWGDAVVSLVLVEV